MTMRTDPSQKSPLSAVFVATDFSAPADDALRQAHARAQARRAALIVCHVVPNQLGVNMLFPQRTVEQGNAQLALQERARHMLIERVVQVTGRAAEQFTAVVETGTPYGVIVEQAEQAGADLIVLGDRGQTGVARAVLGSVAERVVRYAHCPVLIVRGGGAAQRILVATDLSDPSLPALDAAAHEAARTGARVTALHCIQSAVTIVGQEYGLALAPPVTVDLAVETRERAEQRLTKAAHDVRLNGELRVVDGAPTETILSTAKHIDADLIVIGTRGLTGLRRVVLGSVAEAVIRNASCTVLAVRLGSEPAQ